MKDIICIGMALVDSIIKGFDPEPISASGYRAVSGSLNVGGEAVNEAVAAAKLGMDTGILCTLGADDAGDMVVGMLKRFGVDTSFVLRSQEHPTPVTTMFVRDDGTRKSITNGAHRYNFHPENYSSVFTGAKAIILGSLFRAPFDDPDIIYSVLNAAHIAGVKIFADTKLPNFKVLGLEDLKKALPLIDYITPNEDEAKYFSGKENPSDIADVFLSYGIKNVVIKLGSKGCYYKGAALSEDTLEEIYLPACDINAVDATGAGDCFVAGLASELIRGTDIHDALKFANACGGICTTAVGAGTALKDRDQVLRFAEINV
jgi:sugar/nucleoside kinase (ribokinase family)